ncbi:MAG: hypothetical protein U5S82_04450 [Gammaproteobacteria bacterium]|nr:hypothetical protein [Gammaproteobacteria bacterium]
MCDIVVISKQSPGGRCQLYMRYGEALGSRLGCYSAVRADRAGTPVAAPALLVDGEAVVPADGRILAPEDIAGHLQRQGFGDAEVAAIAKLLQEILDRWRDEWGGGS